QAEDGIRDLIVTGVQTCALPISSAASATVAELWLETRTSMSGAFSAKKARTDSRLMLACDLRQVGQRSNTIIGRKTQLVHLGAQIGRASCRETGRALVRCTATEH